MLFNIILKSRLCQSKVSWAICTYLRLEGLEGGGGGTLLGRGEGGGAGNEGGEGSKLEHGCVIIGQKVR